MPLYLLDTDAFTDILDASINELERLKMYTGAFETRIFDDRLPVMVFFTVEEGFAALGEITRNDYKPLSARSAAILAKQPKTLQRLRDEMTEIISFEGIAQ